jgi:hypothetical protein
MITDEELEEARRTAQAGGSADGSAARVAEIIRDVAMEIGKALLVSVGDVSNLDSGGSLGQEEIIDLEDELIPSQLQFWLAGQEDVDGNRAPGPCAQLSLEYEGQTVWVEIHG